MQYRPDYYYTQAAALPYRYQNSDLQILLITTRKRKRWIIPKGIVEADLSARETASMEAWEEAGIEGNVRPEPLGNYEYEKWGGTCRVTVFPMNVSKMLDDWPESDMRERRWVSLQDALSLVDQDEIKAFINRLPDIVNQSNAEDA